MKYHVYSIVYSTAACSNLIEQIDHISAIPFIDRRFLQLGACRDLAGIGLGGCYWDLCSGRNRKLTCWAGRCKMLVIELRNDNEFFEYKDVK